MSEESKGTLPPIPNPPSPPTSNPMPLHEQKSSMPKYEGPPPPPITKK